MTKASYSLKKPLPLRVGGAVTLEYAQGVCTWSVYLDVLRSDAKVIVTDFAIGYNTKRHEAEALVYT